MDFRLDYAATIIAASALPLLESRAVVPARSSCHGISCSRHLSLNQAETPLILAAQIFRSTSDCGASILCRSSSTKGNGAFRNSLQHRSDAKFCRRSNNAANRLACTSKSKTAQGMDRSSGKMTANIFRRQDHETNTPWTLSTMSSVHL